ncbi:MAG TPA: MAPEG family protein [Bacteriovoracaceae bacterium]|nr:MAPEG family protein [Bacteriovoracaceae bacterium]
MTIEMKMVAFSAVLGLFHIILSSHITSFQRGYKWTASPRDEQLTPLKGIAGRLERALRNFIETFPIFLAAVVVTHMAGKNGLLTSIGAQTYFWGRLAYLPAYAFGINILRSMIWNVATIGIILIWVALI